MIPYEHQIGRILTYFSQYTGGLEQRIALCQRKIQAQTTIITALETQNAKHRKLNSQQQFNGKQQHSQQLDQQKADMAGQGAIVADLSGAKARLEQEVHDQKAELSSKEDAIAGNSREIAGLTRAKGLLEQQVGEQTAELESKDTLIANLTSTKEELAVQVRQLLEDAGGNTERLSRQLKEKSDKVDQLQQQVEQRQQHIAGQATSIADLEALVKEHQVDNSAKESA